MHKIFQNSKEPLFGRADRIIYLKPFPPSTLKEILTDYKAYTKENLFCIFMITGGVPKYIDTLTRNKSFSKEDIIDLYLQENSLFVDEGKTILIEEFGKEYRTYSSGTILEKLYHELFIESSEYNLIGNYWECGNKNELDIVAINDLEKSMVIAEVKINLEKAKMKLLQEKSIKLIQKYNDYKIEYKLLGMQNLDELLNI